MRVIVIAGFLFLSMAVWSNNILNAQEINFKFGPPDQIKFTQILKTTKFSQMGDLEKRTDISTLKAEITIKKIESGYEVYSVPVSFDMTRNGEPVKDPITNLISNVEITTRLDSLGHMVEVQGFDKLMENLMSMIPPEQQEMISGMINEEILVNKEIVEWEARIGEFIGLSVEIGDFLEVSDEMQLPNGASLPFTSKTKFAGLGECGDTKCVRIEFAYDSDASRLIDFVENSLKDFAGKLETEMDDFDSNESSISGWGERLIDPETMLIYSETSDRVLNMTMDIPNMGKVQNITKENREYTFQY